MEYLPMAIGIALSPIPIIALIIILFSDKAKKNSLVFSVTWVLIIGAISAFLVAGVSKGAVAASSDGHGSALAIIQILLGVLMLYISFKNFIKRPKKGDVAPMPKWMEKVESFTPREVFGISATLAAINLKNFPLMVVAAPNIFKSTAFEGSAFMNWFLFVCVAVSTIIGIALIYFIAGKSAEKVLLALKQWLIAHNNIIMFWLFLIMGVLSVKNGSIYFF